MSLSDMLRHPYRATLTPVENGPSRTPLDGSRTASPRRRPPLPHPKQNDSIRKWVSTQDFQNSGFATLPRRTGAGSPSARRFGSSSSLATNTLVRSLSHIGFSRDPVFHPEQGILQMFVRGRPINLLTPKTDMIYDMSVPNPAPKESLKLEWIYGYRGKDCRSNLHYLPTGEMLYFTATVVILYNAEDQVQRHYMGHTDDVKCLAVHPNRLLIASGQTSKQGSPRLKTIPTSPMSPTNLDSLLEENENSPHVRIWDSITLQTQQVIGMGEFERSISCVSFSKVDGGQLLAAVDDSYEHTLSIWDWQRKKKVTETKSANEQVFSCEFHPTDRQLLITCGKSHISFWTFDGVVLQKKMGVFEGREKPKYVLCVGFCDSGDVLSGDSNGTISVWDCKTGRVCRQISKTYQSGVFSLFPTKDGHLLSGGGGKDRRLIEWNNDLTQTGRVIEIPELAGSVRTISQGKGNLILIGTTHNCILQGSFDLGFNYLIQGHTDDLWGLCAHPLQQQFVSCGYDRTLKMWDGISRSLIWTKDIADPVHSVCFHPSGSVLVVGTTVGRWVVLDALTRDVVIGQKDGNDIISAVIYAPDGRSLAVASRDGNVYVYTVSENAKRYNRLGICGVHSSFVMAVDWSQDGQYLRTNSGDHEVLYWNAVTCKPVSEASKVRDVQWATCRCSLNFDTIGIWGDNSDGTEINGCDRSHDQKLLAVAEDTGLVKLFTYPVNQPKASSRDYSGHSSRVTSVRFLQNDCRLITIGGKDTSVFQWTIYKV